MAGSRYGASEYARRDEEEGVGGVLYGWDGDPLAWETDYVRQQILHYVHEPHSFVPLLQATTRMEMLACMLQRPKDAAREYESADGYDMDRDPLYNGSWHPGLDDKGELLAPLTRLHFYQCDHLGTPQALTDEQGEIAWEANYRAWGQTRITIQEAARKAGLHNPIRFQGQYFDEESGLHYNRYRYYDPHSGRFISKDPIGLLGGANSYQYARNPIEWRDPLGLSSCHSRVAAQELPRFKGKSRNHIESAMAAQSGWSVTKRSPTSTEYMHVDGSYVRIDAYGNVADAPYASANNAHVHKQLGKKVPANLMIAAFKQLIPTKHILE